MYKSGIIFLKPEPLVLIFSLQLGGMELWRGLSLVTQRTAPQRMSE